MPGIESFDRQRSHSDEDHLVLNARSIPVIDAGLANIKLGIFSVVCRHASVRWQDPKCGIALAYAVKCAVFGEPSAPIQLGSIIPNPQDILDHEVEATVTDESLGSAVALAYAAEIIRCAWRSGTEAGSLRSSSDIIDRATRYNIGVPNIVELWGPSAINKFFLASIDFMQRSVVVETL